jgi:predicted dehydrogenase
MSASPHRRTFLQATAGTAALSAATYARIPGANERIGVGFVGYGLMAKKHVATFRAAAGCDVVALSETHRGRLEEGIAAAGGKGKAAAYPDFRKLLDDKAVNAVVTATPDHWHALITMMACAAGKDVYVEKPLTLFVREGEWMQAVAAKHKNIVQVGTQQRSGKHYQRARDLVQKGHIGQVMSVRMPAVRNVMPGFGNPADREPPKELDYDRWLGPAPARKYNPNRSLYHFRWFWDYSGGQMTNLGAHQLDVAEWFLGLDSLRSVSSIGGRYALTDNGETPDTQDALFDCGTWSGSFTMREASLGPRTGYGVEFHGTRGTLGISRSGFTVTPDADILPVNMIPGVKEGHPVGGPKAVPAEKRNPRTTAIDDKTGSSDEQYTEHARNFLECIRSRKAPIADLASAHRVAVACHLANLSLRLGRSLKWDWKTNSVPGDAEANAALVRPYRAPWDRELKALGVE